MLRKSFGFLLNIKKSEKKIDLLQSAYKRNKEALISHDKPFLTDVSLYLSMVTTFYQKNDQESLYKLVDIIVGEGKTYLYGRILNHFQHDQKVCEYLFQEIKKKDLFTYYNINFLIKALTFKNEAIVNELINYSIQNYPKEKCEKLVFNYLQCFTERCQDVYFLIKSIMSLNNNAYINIYSWNIVLHKVIQSNDKNAITLLFNYVRNRDDIHISSYNTLLKFIKDSPYDKEILSKMESEIQRKKIKKDHQYLTTLLTTYVKNKDFEKAEMVKDELILLEEFDLKSATSIIYYLSQASLDKCFLYYQNIKSNINDPNILNPLLNELIKRTNDSRTLELLPHYFSSKVPLEEPAIISLLSLLKKHSIDRESFDKFEEIYKKHLAQNPSKEFLNTLFSYFITRYKEKEFKELFEFLTKNDEKYQLDHFFYFQFINYSHRNQDFEFFNQFIKRFIENPQLNKRLYERLLNFFIENEGKRKELGTTIDEIFKICKTQGYISSIQEENRWINLKVI